MLGDSEWRRRWISAEMRTAWSFAQEGYAVSFPFAPVAYDLIVDNHKRLYRVQVKSAGSLAPQRQRKAGLGDRPHYRVELLRWRKNATTQNIRIGSGEFDILCAVCGENIYVLPVSMLIDADHPEYLIRCVRIKPLTPDLKRADSHSAGMRWEQYRNVFKLEPEIPKGDSAGKSKMLIIMDEEGR